MRESSVLMPSPCVAIPFICPPPPRTGYPDITRKVSSTGQSLLKLGSFVPDANFTGYFRVRAPAPVLAFPTLPPFGPRSGKS
jgi:hypothetical protein